MKRKPVLSFGLCILATFLWMAATPLAAHAITQTFNYTGDQQNFTVPAGVTSLTIQAFGAEGGTGYASDGRGGGGDVVNVTIAVAPGEKLAIFVGGQGGNGTADSAGAGGYNGGGDGGHQLTEGQGGGGGGGASDVRLGGIALGDRIVVAGGGGGNGSIQGTMGGGGGYPVGEDGTDGNAYGGGGGTQSSGGSGGTSNGTDGSSGLGGNGGVQPVLGSGSGGGGGGGYYGGGGGGAGDAGAGGGGGSSFVVSTALGSSFPSEFRAGDGQVIITYATPVPTMNEWGMVIFVVFAGLISLYFVRRQKRA